MVLALHMGLLHAVSNETNQAVLVAALRSLCVLCSATPYDRLPGHLLLDVLKAAYGVLNGQSYLFAGSAPCAHLTATAAQSHALCYNGSDRGEVLGIATAALGCIAQALSSKTPSDAVRSWLLADAQAYQHMCAQHTALHSRLMTDNPATDRERSMQVTNLSLQVPRLVLSHAVADNPIQPHPSNGSHSSTETSTVEAPACAHVLDEGIQQENSAVSSSRANIQPAEYASLPIHKADERSSKPLPLCAILLSAAQAPDPLNRIEALAGLRGMCINYPSGLPEGSWPYLCSACTQSIQACAQTALRSPRSSAPSPRQVTASGKTQPVVSRQHSRGTLVSGTAESSMDSSSSSHATSEDRAAQHAVKLLGDYLSALSKQLESSQLGEAPFCSSTSAAQAHQKSNSQLAASTISSERLSVMWHEASDLLLGAAVKHQSYLVRSAGLSAFCELRSAQWLSLGPDVQQQLLSALNTAVQQDSIATARCAGWKALGHIVLLPMPGVLQDDQQTSAVSLLAPVVDLATTDAAVTVRVTAAWAVANACEALRGQVVQLRGQLPATDTSPVVLRLASAVLSLSRDVNKVRANGARGLGHMLAAWQVSWFSNTPASSNGSSSSSSTWLSDALASLQSCLTTGNMKVQWNACYAVAAMFENASLLQQPEVSGLCREVQWHRRTGVMQSGLICLGQKCVHASESSHLSIADIDSMRQGPSELGLPTSGLLVDDDTFLY